MDKKLRETTNLCVEIMNSKRQMRNMVTWYKLAFAAPSTWSLTSLLARTGPLTRSAAAAYSLGFLSCPIVRAKSGKERARERVLGMSLSVTSQLTVESRIDRAENA